MINPSEQNLGLDLEAAKKNWQDQVQHLIDRGYPKLLGVTSEEYRRQMPQFTLQPEEFKGRFDRPLLIDPRVGYVDQLRLMGVENDLNDGGSPIVVNAPEVVVPKDPYQIWVQDGLLYKLKSGQEVLKLLPASERGLTLVEGLALLREMPDFRRQTMYYSMSFLGSRDGYGHIPHILHWTYNDNPKISYISKDPAAGEEECWSHSLDLVNKTGGWPTCGVIDLQDATQV